MEPFLVSVNRQRPDRPFEWLQSAVAVLYIDGLMLRSVSNMAMRIHIPDACVSLRQT